jgi:hypothetical protein
VGGSRQQFHRRLSKHFDGPGSHRHGSLKQELVSLIHRGAVPEVRDWQGQKRSAIDGSARWTDRVNQSNEFALPRFEGTGKGWARLQAIVGFKVNKIKSMRLNRHRVSIHFFLRLHCFPATGPSQRFVTFQRNVIYQFFWTRECPDSTIETFKKSVPNNQKTRYKPYGMCRKFPPPSLSHGLGKSVVYTDVTYIIW